MKLWKALCCFFLVLCLFGTSCRHTETITEYIPVEVDVAGLVQPLLDIRPQPVVLIEDVQTLSDIMENSVAFQNAYMDWKAYAEALESFCLSLGSSDAT